MEVKKTVSAVPATQNRTLGGCDLRMTSTALDVDGFEDNKGLIRAYN